MRTKGRTGYALFQTRESSTRTPTWLHKGHFLMTPEYLGMPSLGDASGHFPSEAADVEYSWSTAEPKRWVSFCGFLGTGISVDKAQAWLAGCILEMMAQLFVNECTPCVQQCHNLWDVFTVLK